MNFKIFRIMCLGLAALWTGLVPGAVHGSFEDAGAGSRASGLGGAFSALADDLYALYYNPAGLVYLRRKELSATYGMLNTGLSDKTKLSQSVVGYGQPLRPEIGTVGLLWQQTTASDLYEERAVTVGYGRKLTQKWAGGVNLKHLYRGYTAPLGRTDDTGMVDGSRSDPLFAGGNSKSNIGMDLGLLFRPYRNYAYGLMLQNVNEPDLAMGEGNRDPQAMMVRTGVAYHERRVTLVGELDTKKSPGGGKRDIYFTAGGEKWWLGSGFAEADLAVRGSLALGSREYSQLTLGLSYRLNAVQVDYGFLMPMGGMTLGSSQGTHRMTLSLRFGQTMADTDYEVRMRAAEIAAKKAEEELEEARKESEALEKELEKLKEEATKRKASLDETRKSSGKDAALKAAAARFAESMDGYWRRKSEAAGVEERIGILTQILKAYAGSGLDVSVAEKELAVAKSDRAKAEVDLAVAWSYYQKIVARGASVPERVELLSRMIERFARTGVDLTNIREELKSLRERK